MGVARDKTLSDLITAVGGVDTSNLLTDATGIQIKNAILAIANAITTNNSLVGLNDVNITSPVNGQALVYDSVSQKWVNGSSSGSAYSETVLWSGSQSTSRWAEPIELSIDISSYKLINVNSNGGTHIILCSSIPTGDATGSNTISVGTFTDSHYTLWFNKNTNILRVFTSTGTYITFNEVVGISF